jgi:beta-mannosidase
VDIHQLDRWKLAGFWPYTPFLSDAVETGIELQGITEWLDASVPGSVHGDLLKAGVIEDPAYERASIACEWVSNRWWVYRSTFVARQPLPGERCELILKGIDYKAHIKLNGKLLGTHEGMFRPAIYDITDKVLGDTENLIDVIFESSPDEMGQIGYTQETCTQKARFGYKWDFCTRLVHIGLYDEVILRYRGTYTLDDIHVEGILHHDGAAVAFTWRPESIIHSPVWLSVELALDGNTLQSFEEYFADAGQTENVRRTIQVLNPKIWHVNGQGKQPLYDLSITIRDAGGFQDSRIFPVGIRSISFERNTGAASNSLPYTLVLNGRKTYMKGVNLTPLDLMYGSIKDEVYVRMVRLLKDANVNIVRVWGGGLIEKELLYDLCDKNGILIWQEFIQSSSGLGNTPSTRPEFLSLLEKTAVHVVKEKRNHTCLAAWSGGNELMEASGVPVSFDNPNIALLKHIVERYDPNRMMFPSSASGPNEFLTPDATGMNHDVHGPWKYGGVKNHYKVFNESDSQLHSEFGVDGMSSLDSLERFLSAKNLVVTDMRRNFDWRHHGEWWDTLERDSRIFGPMPDLNTFICCSQFIQAEGIRYALESNRRRMFQNSGSFLWQFNEPWPNVSCTSIIDYYGKPKLAYYALQMAYRPIVSSLKYSQLAYSHGEEFSADVFVHNELSEVLVTIHIKVANAKGQVTFYSKDQMCLTACSTERIRTIDCTVPDTGEWFDIILDIDVNEETISSRYRFLVKGENGLCSSNAVKESQSSIGNAIFE